MATCPTCRTHYPDDVQTCTADGATLLPDETIAAMDPDLAPGQTVGEYRVEAKIGEGGFGAVYRAVHPLIGKAAAIKVLNKQYSSSPQMVSRFVAEARAVNQIKNRNIVDIFSFGALDDGRQYYVMELLDGMTCSAYIRKKGRLSPEEAVPILRAVGRALDAAHAAGIAHRDLKPENVFLTFEEDAVFPKLLDFGIAKLLGDSITSGHKTRTGTPMGTPHYMSPEQCRGRNVDHRTDIYSFGVLVFEALTGKVPFDGEDVMEILVKHTSAPAPLPSEVCPALPAAMDAPVLGFLEKDPGKRPASLGAGMDALAAAAAGVGFDVKVSTRKVGDALPVVGVAARPTGDGSPVRVGSATPAEVRALSDARTMLQEDGAKTFLSGEADVKPAQSRRTVRYGVAGAVAVAGALTVVLALRPRDPPAPIAVATPAGAVTTTAETRAAEPPPKVTPSAAAEAAPVAPAEVELTFDATPKVVEVFLDGNKIGTSAAPIRVKRAEGKVKLTFKAAGHTPQDLEVLASANTVVAVRLVKVAAGVRTNKDLSY
jgi:serine/threonine-protein kinase